MSKTSSVRDLHAPASLQRMLAPQSVALVGASQNPASFATRTLQNLAHFTGTIYLVNAKYESIGQARCYPNLASLPEVPDCVIAAIPRDGTEAVVAEAVRVGSGGVLLYASGYSETGLDERTEQQIALVNQVTGTGTRLLGPNCMGLINAQSGFAGTFAHVPERISRRDGRGIGLVSQSGALGVALVQAVQRGVSFSHMLACGNSCDVDVADLIAYLAEDPACGVIACVFEGTNAPQRLLQAAAVARKNGKPVVVCKIASGEEGAAAAMSHTGSLAGSSAGYQALFHRAGFVLVEDFEALVETAGFFAKAPPWRAAGAAILSPSGGGAILCADWAEKAGVPMPQPGEAASAALRTVVPEFGSARNPCDVTAQVINDPVSLQKCAQIFCEEPAIGALVMPHITAYAAATNRTLALAAVVREAGVPLCVVWMSEWLEGPGAIELEASESVCLFRSARRAFATLAAWNAWSTGQQELAEPHTGRRASPPHARSRAAEQLAVLHDRTALTEREAKQVLSTYGVAVASDTVVQSEEDAVQAARKVGYPVVLKVESADIAHKTEAGVVKLSLASDDAVRAAYTQILANAAQAVPGATLQGVLVQPMLPPGLEMLVGGRIDPLFGPMVVVGFGGVLVELLKDSAAALAPVSPVHAKRMLVSLRGASLLSGYRGSEAVDIDVLAIAIARISELISDHASVLSEIDVNPLICAGQRVVAVDGLIIGRRRISTQ
ncbi:MAG: acetate--CoA ligase family protein [Devosia sp.]